MEIEQIKQQIRTGGWGVGEGEELISINSTGTDEHQIEQESHVHCVLLLVSDVIS